MILLLTNLVSILSAADSTHQLGRLDVSSLPQQTLMELFLQDTKLIEKYRDEDDEIKDISKWPEVVTDLSGNVIKYDSVKESFWICLTYSEGKVHLDALPETLADIHLEFFHFEGTLTTQRLPKGLLSLRLRNNALSGVFEIGGLPSKIRVVDIYHNRFEGYLSLEALPTEIQELYSGGNSFSGSVYLTCLPKTLQYLGIGDNRLSGSIQLTGIPSGMKTLDIAGNAFQQDILVIGKIPPCLNKIMLGNLAFVPFVDTEGNEVKFAELIK